MTTVWARLREGNGGRAAVAAVAVLLYTQVVLPALGPGSGTPAAILFSGLVFGLVHAVSASGLVVVYRSLKVVNFAQTALGAAGAELTFQLVQRTDVPFLIALPAGLMLAVATGVAFHLVVARPLMKASRLTLTMATVAASGLSVITVHAVSRLPFFSGPVTPGELVGAESIRRLLPFPGFEFAVGGFPVPFGFSEVLALETTVTVLVVGGMLLRFTRTGARVRALADNPDRLAGMAVDPNTTAMVVWGASALLGAVAVVLFGALTTPGSARGVAPGVLLPALAAAVVGRFRSLPVTIGAAVAVGVLAAATRHGLPDHPSLDQVVALAVIVIGLIPWQRGRTAFAEHGRGENWAGSEVRRLSPEVARLRVVARGRAFLLSAALLLAVAYPYLVDVVDIRFGGVVAVTGIVALSIVVLTGWAGQVSLGQWGLAAVGGIVGGALTSRTGLSFWLAVPVAMVAAAGVGVVIGLSALRVRGLFLAVVTLAAAFVANLTLFESRYFGWLLPGEIDRPSLFFLDFADERSMYFLALGAVLATAIAVRRLRASAIGRVLIASRDHPADLEAFGYPVVRARLTAFALSGALAGLAGVLFVHQQGGATADAFTAQRSVDTFLMVVVGGVGSVTGSLAGPVAWLTTEHLWPTQPLVAALRPVAALAVLTMFPAGLAGLGARVRDAAVGVVHRGPRLAEPEARGRVALAPTTEAAGLAVLGPEARWSLPSTVHRQGGPPAHAVASEADA